MNMRAHRQIELAGRPVQVRELTVGDVRAWLAEAQAGNAAAVDLVAEMLLPGVSLADLARMSDLSVADLDAAAPSELAALAEACKAVNPDFFNFRAALVTAALAGATSAVALPASRMP